jgi:hypothetical protein
MMCCGSWHGAWTKKIGRPRHDQKGWSISAMLRLTGPPDIELGPEGTESDSRPSSPASDLASFCHSSAARERHEERSLAFLPNR